MKAHALKPGDVVRITGISETIGSCEGYRESGRWYKVLSGVGAQTTLGETIITLTVYREWTETRGRRGDEWEHTFKETRRVWVFGNEEVEVEL